MTIRSLLLVTLVLAACSPVLPSDDDNQLLPPQTTFETQDGVLDLSPLRIRIENGSNLRAELSGPDSYDITEDGVRTMFVQHLRFDEPSTGFGDLSIPSVIGLQLQTDQACFILGQAGSGVYLPLQAGRLMQCGVFHNADNHPIIAAVGYSETFESPDHLGSMILIPREDDAIVIYDVVDFPEYQSWLRTKSNIFYGDYPNENLWPPTTPAAEKFYQNATDEVGRAIGQPSEEVAKNMNELEAWTQRITLY